MNKFLKRLTILALIALLVPFVMSYKFTPLILWEIADLLAIGNIHLGNYFKIKRKSIGWAFSALSVIYFIGRSLSIGLVSQCIGHAISLCLAIYGFLSWKRDETKQKILEDNGLIEPENTVNEAPEFVFQNGILFKINERNADNIDLNEITYHRYTPIRI